MSSVLYCFIICPGPGYKKRSKSPRVPDKKKASVLAKAKKMAPIRIKLSPIGAKRKKSFSVSMESPRCWKCFNSLPFFTTNTSCFCARATIWTRRSLSRRTPASTAPPSAPTAPAGSRRTSEVGLPRRRRKVSRLHAALVGFFLGRRLRFPTFFFGQKNHWLLCVFEHVLGFHLSFPVSVRDSRISFCRPVQS